MASRRVFADSFSEKPGRVGMKRITAQAIQTRRLIAVETPAEP